MSYLYHDSNGIYQRIPGFVVPMHLNVRNGSKFQIKNLVILHCYLIRRLTCYLSLAPRTTKHTQCNVGCIIISIHSAVDVLQCLVKRPMVERSRSIFLVVLSSVLFELMHILSIRDRPLAWELDKCYSRGLPVFFADQLCQ